MKRLARRLFTLCSAVSLLLCVAACVLWVRSYRAAEGWSWSDGMRVPTAGYGIAWQNVLLVRGGRVFFIADRNMGGTAHQRRLGLNVAEAAYRVHYAPPVARAGAGASGWRLLGFEHFTYSGYPMIASTMPWQASRPAPRPSPGAFHLRRPRAGVLRFRCADPLEMSPRTCSHDRDGAPARRNRLGVRLGPQWRRATRLPQRPRA